MKLLVVLDPDAFVSGLSTVGQAELDGGTSVLTTLEDPDDVRNMTLLFRADEIEIYLPVVDNVGPIDDKARSWEESIRVLRPMLEPELFRFNPGRGSIAEEELIKKLSTCDDASDLMPICNAAAQRILNRLNSSSTILPDREPALHC